MATGSASDIGSGAAKGAALGAPLGFYGAAGGAVIGGLYEGLFGGKSDDGTSAANAARQSQSKQAAITLENYRQSARDQYHNLLTAETTPYQGASNWLKAMTGSGMSTAGLAANENPLSLQDTGVGAPTGSNYAGWDESTKGNGTNQHYTIHHMGIGDQLAAGSAPGGSPTSIAVPADTMTDSNGRNYDPSTDTIHREFWQTHNVADPNADVAAARDPANNSTYTPAQANAAPPQGNYFAGSSFMPRRP